MYTVVQSDVVDNAMVANVLQVSHMAGLSYWVKISPRTSAGRSKMVVCLIAAAKLCNSGCAHSHSDRLKIRDGKKSFLIILSCDQHFLTSAYVGLAKGTVTQG